MNDRLRQLLEATRALPPVHWVVTFLLSLLIGLLTVHALAGGGGGQTQASGSDSAPVSKKKQQQQQPSGPMSVSEAAGQLTVLPVRVSSDSDFASAEQLARKGRLGGVLLTAEGGAAPPKQVLRRVLRLRRAAAGQAAPLLVIAGMEGLTNDPGYCASLFPGSRAALKSAIDGRPAGLVSGLGTIGANALLAVSFKDDSAGCWGGADANPAQLTQALQRTGIVLLALGARRRDFRPYAKAYGAGLRVAAASATPRHVGTPTWRNTGALSQIHGAAQDLVIATPDLSALRQRETSDNVVTALDSGADLPLYGEQSPAAVSTLRTWLRRHPRSLQRSCRRIMAIKERLLGSQQGPDACPRDGGPA